VAAEGDLDGDGDSDGEVRATGRTTGSNEPRRGARCREGGAAPRGCLNSRRRRPRSPSDGRAEGVMELRRIPQAAGGLYGRDGD